MAFYVLNYLTLREAALLIKALLMFDSGNGARYGFKSLVCAGRFDGENFF